MQPNEGTSVTITCPIPENLLTGKENIKVVCVIDGKLIILETKLVEIDGVWCAKSIATHFSPYAMVVDSTNTLSNVGETTTPVPTQNPKTGQSNSMENILIVAIMSVVTLGVVSKKLKFKVVKKD